MEMQVRALQATPNHVPSSCGIYTMKFGSKLLNSEAVKTRPKDATRLERALTLYATYQEKKLEEALKKGVGDAMEQADEIGAIDELLKEVRGVLEDAGIRESRKSWWKFPYGKAS